MVWVTDAARRRRAGDRLGDRRAGIETVRLAEGQLGNVIDLAASPGRGHGRRRRARRQAAGRRRGVRAGHRAGRVRRRRRRRAVLVAGLGLAGLGPAGPAAAAPDPAGADRGPRAHRRRDRRPVRRQRPGVHAPTACTWPSCPGAASTRCTTSSPSTCRSRSAAARTWCRWPRRPCRRSARCRAAGRWARIRPSRTRTRQRRCRRTYRGIRRRRRYLRPRGGRPGGRGQVLRAARGEGRPRLAARAGRRRARRGRRQPRGRRAAAGPGAVRPAQARSHRAGRRARLVRGQRRRHPAGGQGPRRRCGSCRPSARRTTARPTSVTVDLSRARFLADPAALWRHAYAEAGPAACAATSGTPACPASTGTRCSTATGRCWTGSGAPTSSPTCCGRWLAELGTSHAYVVRAGQDFRGRRRGPAAVGLLGADLSRDAGRPLAGGPGAAGRVVRPAGPLAARGARRRCSRPATSCSRSTGGRSTRCSAPRRCWPGRSGKPVELAVRPQGADPEVRRRVGGRAAARRAAAAVPGLGGRAAPPGPRAQRRADRLPARPGHDRRGLGPLPPRPARPRCSSTR